MGKKGKPGKKERRASRKERKDAEKAAREEQRILEQQRAKRVRMQMIAIPILTGAAALVCWLVLDDTRLVGVTALVGGLLFLMVSLSGLGSSVKPRDRLRSGAIDFGSSSKK